MTHPLEHVLSWMPFQAEIIFNDTHREILLSGAYGSAKTRTLCGRVVRKAQNPGARICLTRKTHTSLIATTVRTLLEEDGELPPVLPPGSYLYKQDKGRIFIHGGGEIVLCGCDNHLRLGSEQFSDVMLDEGIETDEAEYIMLLGRMRVKYTLPDGSPNVRTMCIATNPGDPSHYLYRRFYTEKRADRLCVESNTAANYYLPADYQESLEQLHGVFRDRYYLGLWVAFEGAIYPMFNPAIHIGRYSGPWDYYVAGVDCGLNHPNTIRVHGCNSGSPRSHVISEFHESGIVSPEFVKVCVATSQQYFPITFVIDSAAADVAQQMREKDLHVILANKDVLPGIRGVQNDLVGTPIGGPLLTMEPTCSAGNEEYSLYRWKEGTEEPVKIKDDALDADRYARMYIRKGFADQRGLIVLDRRPCKGPRSNRTGRFQKWDPDTDRMVIVESELDLHDERLWGGDHDDVGEGQYLRRE